MCWGRANDGQLGQNSGSGDFTTPQLVWNITDAVQVSAGAKHTCAVRQTGQIMCWGWGTNWAAPKAGTSDTRAVAAATVRSVWMVILHPHVTSASEWLARNLRIRHLRGNLRKGDLTDEHRRGEAPLAYRRRITRPTG